MLIIIIIIALAVFDSVSVYNSPQVTPIKDKIDNDNNDIDRDNNHNNSGNTIKDIMLWIQTLKNEVSIIINECREGGNIKQIIMKTLLCIFFCLKSLAVLIVRIIVWIARVIVRLFSCLTKLRRQ